MPERKVIQPHIPGLSRVDRKPRPPKLSEAALQSQARATLALLGYATAEVGAGRKQVSCPCCSHRFFPEGWQGNTPGVPDLLAFRYHADFPPVAAMIELKQSEGSPIRPAQKALADAGRSRIAHTIGGIIAALLAAENELTAYHAPPEKIEQLERFLTQNEGKI